MIQIEEFVGRDFFAESHRFSFRANNFTENFQEFVKVKLFNFYDFIFSRKK